MIDEVNSILAKFSGAVELEVYGECASAEVSTPIEI